MTSQDSDGQTSGDHTPDSQAALGDAPADISAPIVANADASTEPTLEAPVIKAPATQVAVTFRDLGLSDKVLSAVEASGYTVPTPIQANAIPHVLPMLSRLESGRARARMPRTLILEPTRELAAQVEESFVKYGANHKLNVALLIGGVSFADQETKITRGADVLIATPGRLLDFSERGKLLLTGIDILVIDEADRMLDMGFIPDIERICKLVPFTRQTLFFSATMPPEITRLTEQFLQNPVRIEVARASTTAALITQQLVASHGGGAKRDTLRRLIKTADGFKNAIIFCNRKRDVAILYKSLEKHGFSVGALHGDMDQRARMLSLDAFKTGAVDLIVCSDVAARGLDIPDVSHVFNFDVPTHAEDYVHRIGRTGRAGRKGTALSIVSRGDEKYLAEIEKVIARKVDWADGVTLKDLPEEEPGETDERRSRAGERDRSSARRPRGGSSRSGGDREPIEATDPTDPTVPRSRRHGGSARPTARDAAPARREPDSARSEPLRAEPSRGTAFRAEADAPRRERTPRPDREASRPAAEGRRPAGETHPHRGRGDNDDRPVLGMGDHVPMFLQRPVKLKPQENTDP
jgi:superfamily II DNA/RNA helicase